MSAVGLRTELLTPLDHVVPVEGTAWLVVRLANDGPAAVSCQVAVEGLPEAWVMVSPGRVPLAPGRAARCTVAITPPRLASSVAGEYPFRLRVWLLDHPGWESLHEGCLTLLPWDVTPQAQTWPQPPRVGIELRRGALALLSGIGFVLWLLSITLADTPAPRTELLGAPALGGVPATLPVGPILLEDNWTAPLPTPRPVALLLPPPPTPLPAVAPSEPQALPPPTAVAPSEPQTVPSPTAVARERPLAPSPTLTASLPPAPVEARGSQAEGGAEPASFENLFRFVAAEYDLDWRLLASVAYHESRLNPQAKGRDGEIGLMQIMPGTWGQIAPQVGVTDPADPLSSVRVGAAFLAALRADLRTRGYPEPYWMLVAYNWGPTNLSTLLTQEGDWGGIPTAKQDYAYRILADVNQEPGWWARLQESAYP